MTPMGEFFWYLLLAVTTIFTVRWLLAWRFSPLSESTIRQLFTERLTMSNADVALLSVDDEQLAVQYHNTICTIQFDALYRRCQENPYQTLLTVRNAVYTFLIALQESETLPEDWSTCVMPLLLNIDLPCPPNLVARPFIGPLAISYVVNTDTYFRWVTTDDMPHMGIDEEQLYAIARANLERSCHALVIDAPPAMADGQDRVLSFQTNDGLDAARVLIPSFFQRFSPRFGDSNLLVAIPARDTLLIAAENDQSHAALLAWRVGIDRAHRPHPLLEELLKISDGKVELWSPDGAPAEA